MQGPLREEQKGEGGEGGGGGTPAFDAVKFRTELMAEFKTLLKQSAPKPEVKKEPEPEPEPDPKDGKKTPAELRYDREIAKLRGEVETERKARTEATESARKEKRTATLGNELGELGIPAKRIQSAIRALDPDIKWDDTGALVSDDGTPLKEFLQSWIKDNEHFLPPKQVGGAGASGGNRNAPKVDIDEIRPGMKADDLARVRAEIARVAIETMRGNRQS
jgi:hypothetical protein